MGRRRCYANFAQSITAFKSQIKKQISSSSLRSTFCPHPSLQRKGSRSCETPVLASLGFTDLQLHGHVCHPGYGWGARVSIGRGNHLLLGIILPLGVGQNQLAGTNLGAGTAGEDAWPHSGGGSSGESPIIPPSLACSTRLSSECVWEQQLRNRAQLCSH